jgi:hypothetical protein
LLFFVPAWQHIEVLDYPPRVRMSFGGRSFVAHEHEWVVRPGKGAYFPMKDTAFHERYELVGD